MRLALRNALIAAAALGLLCPAAAIAQTTTDDAQRSGVAADQQTNVPAQAQQAENTVERAVRRFGVGVVGGVALDPELIAFGAHGTFGPIFIPNVSFRPGLEFGVGEVTTTLGINLDVLYTLPGSTRTTRWAPYAGAGPNFSLSHQGFETNSGNSRFNFSDTSFETGLNFIAGVRNRSGLFLEMRATAYGVSNIRLLAGYNF